MSERPTKRMGRPPLYDRDSLLKERLVVLVSAEMKEWVQSHGGSEMVREVISRAQMGRERLDHMLAEIIAAQRSIRIISRGGKEPYWDTSISDHKGRVENPYEGKDLPLFQILIHAEDNTYLVSVADILLVQEPGEGGTVLWERGAGTVIQT